MRRLLALKSAILLLGSFSLVAAGFAQEPVNHSVYQPVASQPVAHQVEAVQPAAYQPSLDLHGAWQAPAPYLSEPLLRPTNAVHQPQMRAPAPVAQPQQHQLSVTQLIAGETSNGR